jgi:hypothetical protein
MSYNIPIPEPKSLEQTIARITFDSVLINVYWRRLTSQVIFHFTNHHSENNPEYPSEDTWFIQSDKEIMDSLCHFFPYHYYQFVVDRILLFEDQTMSHGKTSTELQSDIYNCCWSDFACDKLVLHMDIHGDETIQDEQDRLGEMDRCSDEDTPEESYTSSVPPVVSCGAPRRNYWWFPM